MSEPKTSEPLHSSWTRSVSSFDSSERKAGFPTIDKCIQLLVVCKQKYALTDVCGQVSDGWKEDLDIGTGDEFRVHSSSVLEECTTKETLGAANILLNIQDSNANKQDSHSESLCNTRQPPNRFHSRFTDTNLNTRISVAHTAIRVM